MALAHRARAISTCPPDEESSQMPIIACVLLPALAAALVLTCGFRPGVDKFPVAASAGVVIAGATSWQSPDMAGWGPLRADALSGYAIMAIGIGAILAGFALNQQLWAGIADDSIGPLRARAHATALPALLACANLALCAGPAWLQVLGLLGVAAVASAALLALRTRAASRAAAWLAVSLTFSAIAIAFGPDMTGSAMPIVLGVAVYAGFAPVHCWRTRALSRLPGGLAAVLSGATFVMGFDLLFRLSMTGTVTALVHWGALIGLVVAAWGVAAGTDIVRTVTYLGLAGMSIVLFGLGVDDTELVAAALRQLLIVLTGTSVLYIAAGGLWAMTGSRRIGTVRGLWRRNPISAVVLAAMTVLISAPLLLGVVAPSTMTSARLVGAGLQSGHGIVFGIGLTAAVVVVVGGALTTLCRMLRGNPDSHPDLAVTARVSAGGHELLLAGAGLLVLVIAGMPAAVFAPVLSVVA